MADGGRTSVPVTRNGTSTVRVARRGVPSTTAGTIRERVASRRRAESSARASWVADAVPPIVATRTAVRLRTVTTVSSSPDARSPNARGRPSTSVLTSIASGRTGAALRASSCASAASVRPPGENPCHTIAESSSPGWTREPAGARTSRTGPGTVNA